LNWVAPDAVPNPVFVLTVKPLPPAPKSVPPVAAPPVTARPTPPPPTPALTWVPLSHWAAQHKIGAPHLLSDLPMTTYALGSPSGVLVMGIGSLAASWNGIQISLGFEPQLIDGEIFLHELDLQKNLEPLLCDPPLKLGTNRVVVIDPGHGGLNTGTRSVVDGRFEKELTLDWAKRLATLLATNGWEVHLTRTRDVDVSLAERVALAGAEHADLFISLHFNSGGTGNKQAGLETYCLTPAGMPSTLTRGFEDNWSEDLPDNAFDEQNLQLALRVHRALLRGTGAEDRGVRRARFIGVLRGQKCPAILIEGGYLSNPAEARLIESSEYRQKLAEAIAGALK
jgi:N-acetylmuramoyl-L-alanine amidase